MESHGLMHDDGCSTLFFVEQNIGVRHAADVECWCTFSSSGY